MGGWFPSESPAALRRITHPLIVERWDRAPDGSWIALLRLGETPEHLGQRYMILRGHTLYHLGLGPYYQSRETAVKEYAKALQR